MLSLSWGDSFLGSMVKETNAIQKQNKKSLTSRLVYCQTLALMGTYYGNITF